MHLYCPKWCHFFLFFLLLFCVADKFQICPDLCLRSSALEQVSSYALLWGGSKAWVRESLVWLSWNKCPNMNHWVFPSVGLWVFECLNPWVLESLSPGGFESLTLWIIGLRCGTVWQLGFFHLGSMTKTSVKKAVMHSVLSSCVCTHTGSGALSMQASQFGKCNCFDSGTLEQERPGCKTWALLRRACTKQCGAASAGLLGPLRLVFVGTPALSVS